MDILVPPRPLDALVICISQVCRDSGAGRREGLLVILLVHGHDFGAFQHPRKVNFGQGPRDGSRLLRYHASVALSVCHRDGGAGEGELSSKVVRFGELRREGPLPLLLLADINLLAIFRGQMPEIVIGLHEIRRE